MSTGLVDPRAELDRYLEGKEFDVNSLLGEVGEEFGSVQFMAVTGSIPGGYFNDESDIDLWVLAERPRADTLRFASHDVGELVDLDVSDAEKCRVALARLSGPAPFAPATSDVRGHCRRLKNQVRYLTRFGCGVELYSTEEWHDFMPSLQEPWLQDVAVRWWELEARRLVTLSRTLVDVKPMVSAVAAARATTAALKSVAARHGQIYPHPKWVAIDLERLGRGDLLALLRRAFELPVAVDEVAAYVDCLTRDVVELLGPPEGIVLQLSYTSGVESREFGDSHLISRWEMRSVRLDRDEVPLVPEDGAAILEVDLDADHLLELEPATRLLLTHNLLWLSAADRVGA